jgi:hypothetical protein
MYILHFDNLPSSFGYKNLTQKFWKEQGIQQLTLGSEIFAAYLD